MRKSSAWLAKKPPGALGRELKTLLRDKARSDGRPPNPRLEDVCKLMTKGP
jgi:hypothetical protein